MGRIIKDGAVSYDDMLPSDEQTKLIETEKGIYSNKYVKINTNTAEKGYIDIDYLDDNGFDIAVAIRPQDTDNKNSSWRCRVNEKGKCNIKGALTYGSGEYIITVCSFMENKNLGRILYSKKAELKVNLNNVSNTGAFLLSTGEVIFNDNMMFIKKATEL